MNRVLIRISDILISLVGLILLSPVFVLLSILILIDSKGPFLFRQLRVGKNNRDFRLLKFRTMVADADKKGLITVGAMDPRITRIGRVLRRYKLDELPQLLNVLAGDMSLVGPRPEVRKYVNMYTQEQMIVLSVKPGITDLSSIEFSRENALLGLAVDADEYYIREVIPAKIKLNMYFIEQPTFVNYFKIIFRTLGTIFK